MAKRLTEKQKTKIIESFKDGETIDFLSKEYNCTKLTIIRNLKINLGEQNYKELIKTKKTEIKKNSLEEKDNKRDFDFQSSNDTSYQEIKEINHQEDYYPDSSFLEISPLDYQIDNLPRKELSSIPISDIDLPQVVYMVVDKSIELEIKLLKDFPEWNFLPNDDLNRKTIEIHLDLKIAKRFCNKEQKVIKVPNTNVFKLVAPLLIQKGISRIVSDDKLISL